MENETTESHASTLMDMLESIIGSSTVGYGIAGLDFTQSLLSRLRVFDPMTTVDETAKFTLGLLEIIMGTSTVAPHRKDFRFSDPTWRENPIYRRWAQMYLSWCQAMEHTVADGGDWRLREQARFLLGILTTAMAPTNTLAGNPAALKRFYETGGKSLVRGMGHFLHDIRHNGGMPSQVDLSGFKVGENLAATPGAVVYRNAVMELIQYQPTTPKVQSRPTLMIVPQIGKYYFMELAPGRSFVEHAVSRGIQFFTISWCNPTEEEQGNWDFDTYLASCLEAVDAVCEITGSDQINTLSLCAGGILTTLLLSYMAAKNDNRIAAAAFGVTLLDFDTPAPIGAFYSGPALRLARAKNKISKLYRGQDLAKIFAWMRPNDLVWNCWVNNYLMGNNPPSFDILAWSVDTTNLPAALHTQFLDIFEHNVLCKPGAMKALGTPVDLSTIKCETFVTGAAGDHLTPWKGCYTTTQLLGGPSTFILSNAGHIAGLVNPPGNPKASYYAGPKPGPDPDEWKAKASKHNGTWWDAWADWSIERGDGERAAPEKLGSDRYPAGDPAPGKYVLQKNI